MKKPGKKKDKIVAPVIESVAVKADQAFNRIIGDLLNAVHGNEQEEVDGLRAVHQALAYHLGTVERLLLHRFDEAGKTVNDEILAERDHYIEKGVEHADFHRKHYLN